MRDIEVVTAENQSGSAGKGDFRADGVCVLAAVGQQHPRSALDHAEQTAEALDIVCLPGCQHEAEWQSSRIAACVQLGGEPAARPAKRLGLSKFFLIPAAQW